MVKTPDFESENSGSSPGEAAKAEFESLGRQLDMRMRVMMAPKSYDGPIDMNVSRRSFTVTVKEWDEGFAVSVPEFIEEMKRLVETTPEELRGDLTIEFDRYGGDYDTSRGELSVHYSRKETDAELEARLRGDMAHKLDAERREREQYEALRAKFG